MSKVNIEVIRDLMTRPTQIRNISIIAHVDHGKSTLADCLVRKAGLSSKDRFTQALPEEQQRGISIKATGVSLHFELDSKPFLINLIDSPGHVDFSAEVTAALRVTDGAVVVVDAVEGVCVQTETVLRQALAERIRPVLLINKLDRVMGEQQLDPEAAYQVFARHIADVNRVVQAEAMPIGGDGGSGGSGGSAPPTTELDPALGNVAFGAGRDGWAFTLATLAKRLAPKFKLSERDCAARLWGEWYYDPSSGTLSTAAGGSRRRTFVHFVLEPIYLLRRLALAEPAEGEQRQELFKKCASLGLAPFSAEEQRLPGKDLFRLLMQRWLPAADVLLELVATHLPSPLEAQPYRVETLYDGPQDDECARAIARCDPAGPLMMYVSKMVPHQNVFYCFGRVFSGTLRAGMRVRVLGPAHTPSAPKVDAYENRPVQRVVVLMARFVESIDECPCGNTIALSGVEDCLTKGGTLTTHPAAHVIRQMRFSVSPVVRVALRPKNTAEHMKMLDGLRKLVRYDGVAHYSTEETGECVLSATGELHLEVLLKALQEFARCEVVASEPVVSYRETVSASSSSAPVLAKSPDKLNRLSMSAEPVGAALCAELDARQLSQKAPPAVRARALVERHGWDPAEAKRVWAFVPESDTPATNLLVDCTRAVQNLGDIRDNVIAAAHRTALHGVLCDEELRGVRFSVHDATVHPDPAHHGPSQIAPMTRAAMLAAQLCAGPRLLEPVLLVTIVTESTVSSVIYGVLNRRRGQVIAEEPRENGSGVVTLRAYLPVADSFKFTDDLRAATSGKAFPMATFDHYAEVPGDPLDPSSKAGQIVAAIRKRKGLRAELPTLSDFLDHHGMTAGKK